MLDQRDSDFREISEPAYDELSSPPLAVRKSWIGHRCVLSVHGELDLAGVPLLERSIQAAVAASAVEIWLDLEPTSFIDIIGVNSLRRARRELRALNRRLAVIAPTGSQPRRVLELVDADRELEAHTTRHSAHAAA